MRPEVTSRSHSRAKAVRKQEERPEGRSSITVAMSEALIS